MSDDARANVRIGVVGPGLIWKHAHEPAIAGQADTFVVSAFCASSERSRDQVASEYPGAPFFFDYHELLAQPDIDAVLVLTPIALNAPVAMAALRADKDVYVEKPMARTLDEAVALVRTSEETGRGLHILEQVGYRSALDHVREMLDRGVIGDVVSYEHIWHRIFVPGNSPDGSADTSWRQRPQFILGTLFDGGHHAIASHSRLFGAPEAVYANSASLRPGYGDSDHEMILFEYPTGVRGFVSHSSYMTGARDRFLIRGTDGVLEIGHGELIVVHNDGSEEREPIERSWGHEAMWAAFARAARDGVEPAYTPLCGLRELSILYGVHDAIERRQRVSIDYPDPRCKVCGG